MSKSDKERRKYDCSRMPIFNSEEEFNEFFKEENSLADRYFKNGMLTFENEEEFNSFWRQMQEIGRKKYE